MNNEMMAMALQQRAQGQQPQQSQGSFDEYYQAAYEAGGSGEPFDTWVVEAVPDIDTFPEEVRRGMAEAYQEGKRASGGGGGW